MATYRAQNQESVIIKSVRCFRLRNERDVLHFQSRTPYVRKLLDEIEDPPGPAALILIILMTIFYTHLIANSSRDMKSNIKPSNVVFNYGQNGVRFSDVQLADFGSTVPANSRYAQDGDQIGTPIFRSPETQLQMKWGAATDICFFGVMLISLIYGQGFHIFMPDVPADSDEYNIQILTKHHQCFGPFPPSYHEIADQDRVAALLWIMQNTPPKTLKSFHPTASREICLVRQPYAKHP